MAEEARMTADLSEADLDRLMACPVVAMDTETLGLDPWRDPLCLVQICDPQGQINVLRTADWPRAQRLARFLQSPAQKIFHNAIFDCSMLLTNVSVEVANPYCTRIASKLARTYGRSHALAGLVQELLGLDLPKELQSSDWSGELSPEQLRYATRDVQHLFEVKHKLEEKMARRPALRSGLRLEDLNARCQAMIPGLVQLKVNGWNVEGEATPAIWGR
jgi:ribonuclease D